MKKAVLILVGTLSVVEVGVSNADERLRTPREFTRSMTIDTRQGPAQRVVEQRVVDGAISRTMTTTLDDGRSATRDLLTVRDQETGTSRSEISGTRFNGDSYSGVVDRARTESGFISDGVFTNEAGATATRSVIATVDSEAGTITKQITRVNFDGEEVTREVVMDTSASRQAATESVE